MLLPYICRRFNVRLLGDMDVLSSLAQVSTIIPFNAPIYSVAEQRQYRKIIGTTDIFWSPHYNVPLAGVMASKKVVTIHDVYHLAFFKQLSLKQRIYAKMIMDNAVKKSDVIITVSDFSKSEIIKYTGCDSAKLNVIYNGVEEYSKPAGSAAVVTKYKLPQRYILFVGNVKPHKNLKTLIKSYLLLGEVQQADFKVLIVGKKEGFLTGDHELMNWVNGDSRLKDSIIFTGFVNDADLSTIYANAFLLVFPSAYEGFGLPPLEAMANGCPVIASDASSIPEVCGNAAIYFPAFDETQLSLKISELLTNEFKRAEAIKRGYERVKLFRWENSAGKHIKLFERLLEPEN